MTREDYVRIASAIYGAKASTRGIVGNVSYDQAIKLIVDRIATEMEEDNVGFDRERFVRACGFEVAPAVAGLGYTSSGKEER